MSGQSFCRPLRLYLLPAERDPTERRVLSETALNYSQLIGIAALIAHVSLSLLFSFSLSRSFFLSLFIVSLSSNCELCCKIQRVTLLLYVCVRVWFYLIYLFLFYFV